MSHTKGPWEVTTSPNGYLTIRTNKPINGNELCSRIASVGLTDFDDLTDKANAQLMAAAPELYEFAKIMQVTLKFNQDITIIRNNKDLIEMCEYAIAKAEGKKL